MKRVIAFLLLLTLPLGFLIGAHKAVDALQDDVVITAHPAYGDPKLVENLTFRTLTTCGKHMWWYTDYTPGEPDLTETKFHFSQEGHGFFEREHEWHDFSLTTTNGMGMSTSGDGLEFENEGIGLLINEVAKDTPAGEYREVTVMLEDYYDYYPLEYWVNLQTEDYYMDEMYDTLRNMGSLDMGGEASGISYENWTECFKFPIQPGDNMTITVGKGANGGIQEIGINTDGNDTGASVSFTTIPVKEGMYFSPVFQYWNGEVIENGEYVYGHGLYYIPFKPVGNTEGTPPWVTFDFEGLEMVYSLKPADRLIAMEESADGTRLHLLANESGKYVYCLFDMESRQLLSRTEIVDTKADANWAFYPEQELLYLLAGGKMALVRTGQDSRVEFVTQWPEEASWIVPATVHYADGILYGTSLEWYEEVGRSVCLIVCEEEGLGYMGYYTDNLNGTGYNSAWLNLESVEFVMD